MSISVAAGRVDITPRFCQTPTGYSLQGRKSWGKRGRLYAGLVLVRDDAGGQVVLIGVELHASTRLVLEAVGQRLAGTGITVPQLFAGATHTHSAPGNFYGWSYYDTFAGKSPGRDGWWVGWLADRLAGGIRKLLQGPLAPARVGYGTAVEPRLTVNRSRAALKQDEVDDQPGPDAAAVLARMTHNPDRHTAFTTPDERLAVLGVDPRLHALVFRALDDDRLLGVYASFGAHNTVSRHDHDFLHGDAFGVATHRARAALGAASVTLVNGSAGDALFALPPDTPLGPQWWPTVSGFLHARPAVKLKGELRWEYVRQVGERLGDLLVRAVAAASADAAVSDPAAVTVGVTYRCSRAPGAPAGGGAVADAWMVGDKVPLGGTFEPGWGAVPKGKKVPKLAPTHPQWPKVPFLAQFAAPLVEVPTEFPVRVVRIGAHSLVGLPGEPTAWMANRVERVLRPPLAPGVGGVMVCGYSGDYCGYLTTPEEYVEQDYEGCSTLWGRWTGAWILDEVRAAAAGRGTPWVARDAGPGAPAATTNRLRPRPPIPGATLRVEPRRDPGAAWSLRGEWYPVSQGLAPVASREDPAVDVPVLVVLHAQRADGTWERLRVDGVPVDDSDPAFEVWVDLDPGRLSLAYDLPFRADLVGRRLRFEVAHPDYVPADPRSAPTPPLPA